MHLKCLLDIASPEKKVYVKVQEKIDETLVV